MICKVCGAQLNDDAKFCTSCGSTVTAEPVYTEAQPAYNVAQQPVYNVAEPIYQATPVAPVQNEVTVDSLPDQYRPLSPWAYWGLQILFAVPIVGLIFLIIFSFKKSNINRRNFARSYWCSLILVAILVVILMATGIGLAGLFDSMY